MEVKSKTKGGLAISCRKTIYFEKGDILKVDNEGFSEKDLLRLIELNLAEDVTKVKKVKKVKSKSKTKAKLEVEEVEWDVVDYKNFSRSELDDYAKSKYGIDLDKRQSLEKMVEQLEEYIKSLDEDSDEDL